MFTKNPTGKFPLGQIVATPGALDLLAAAGVSAYGFVERHANGDWGDLLDFDNAQNEDAIVKGYRIISKYILGEEGNGEVICIITEADRSATTVLTPEEY